MVINYKKKSYLLPNHLFSNLHFCLYLKNYQRLTQLSHSNKHYIFLYQDWKTNLIFFMHNKHFTEG